MPAPATAREFVELVQKADFVDRDRLAAYLASLQTTDALSAEPAAVAGIMVRDGILTNFQAEQILLGKWRRFSIGKYQVLEKLGSGRFGSVYLCAHKPSRRRVAVKILPTSLAEDPGWLERFYREARAIAGMDHANIVHAYDIDQDNKVHFLVMEYVDGSSLEHIVDRGGPMALTRAAHYIRQAALGLQHIHEMGIVHRDIKPADILVDRSGTVKIIDLGLCRFVGGETETEIPRHPYVGLSPYQVLGTPDYIAPEQVLDPSGVDIRADIYSLGATFYYCLTGRPPFPEGSMARKLSRQQTREPEPIQQLQGNVPENRPLAALIEQMMAKRPASRPRTPQEVVDALTPFTAQPIAPPPEDEMPRLSPAASREPMAR
jgi:serine/threonine protein kinase